MLKKGTDLTRLPFLVKYAITTLLILAATLMTSGLWLLVERAISAPLFLAAIAISAYLFGMRAGFYATLLSGLAIDYYFVQPFHAFTGSRDEIVRLVLFYIEGGFLSLLIAKVRAATDELRDSREELRQLTQHQQTLRETEQKRIAIEIHDELGQALTGLKLDISLLNRGLTQDGAFPDPGDISKGLDELASKVDSTIGSVRRIASEIRPSILDDFGLVAALEWQSGQFQAKSGVICDFSANTEDLSLDHEIESGVFRIAQEALTNIARHAGASVVEIGVIRQNGEAIFSIRDNGRGFDVGNLIKKRSLGLIGMRERARLLGGELNIESKPGNGTLVKLTVPVSVPN